jgi:hypothetical protein
LTADNKASGSSSTLQALFPVGPGLLVLLLPRELLLFDLDLGQPAASTPLPSSMAAFSHLLGVFGGGVCQGGGDEGGLDFVYCTHVDGGLSVWVRVPGALRFKLGSSSRLTPAPLRGANSQVRGGGRVVHATVCLGLSFSKLTVVAMLRLYLVVVILAEEQVCCAVGGVLMRWSCCSRRTMHIEEAPICHVAAAYGSLLLQVSLAMIKACLWRSHAAAQSDQASSAQTAASTAAITDQLNRSLAALHLTTRDAGASATVGSRSRADGEQVQQTVGAVWFWGPASGVLQL